jgi:ubiquinone/menaquinone biosynthesis C-methylase UbiE
MLVLVNKDALETLLCLKDWEAFADWYDRKQGERGDLWHRALIDPVTLRLVGNCARKDVLDLGCGNGYLSRRLARKGARVTAVDSSPRMIKNAKSHDPRNALKIRYVRSNADRLTALPNSSFDMVVANMSLMDIEDAEGAIREAARVLRNGGRLVASISHPCFDTLSNSCWVAEKSLSRPLRVYRKVRAYRTPFAEEVPWRVGESEREYTLGFHRPLNWYARVLSANGLAITALEEPAPTKEFLEEEAKKEGDLDAPGFLEVPLHLVIEATKFY